ncbi:MAG: hypothetical protein ACK514_18035 [Bacteroidota bacterium]|jgi:hypothetical protein|nr:hypothetical protein [Cytophagales bacterium]MCZ8069722.1 hypothetical protein [Cytophagales bacterium]
MKTLFTLSFLFISAMVVAQTHTELPRTDFLVNLSESSLTLKPGESKQVTLSIVRSKYYAKEKAILGLMGQLPKGITVTYEPAEGNFDSSLATISVAADAVKGAYNIVLSSTLSTKKKGTILKVIVDSNEVASK